MARTSKYGAGIRVLPADECPVFRVSCTEYRTTLSLALLLCVFAELLLASPAVAQESVFSTPGTPPRYEVFSDGTIIIDGDVIGDCKLLLQEVQATGTAPSRKTLKQVEICTEAGFPPRGSDALPDTGGLPVSVVVGALLLGGGALGLLGFRRRFVP